MHPEPCPACCWTCDACVAYLVSLERAEEQQEFSRAVMDTAAEFRTDPTAARLLRQQRDAFPPGCCGD